MMRSRLLSLFLLVAVPFASAADPPASIDDQIAKLIAARAQLDKDKAVVEQLEKDLKVSVKELNDKLAALGIIIGPPVPVDPLVASVQAAYKADPSVGKASDVRALALVYREIAKQMGSIGTTDGLASVMSSSRSAAVADRLPTIRPLIGADFAKHIPPGSVALTADQKDEAAKTLIRYAELLEGLK